MRAGRKPQGVPTEGSSAYSRNLIKGHLGSIIFGCKNATIGECFSKQLFGLPAQHLPYVKNIDPGLPLFLFNYSDRKLHGIFEAASSGQMNIDPYAWTDGSQKTSYPAQVQIRVRLHCQPLPEDQFKPIIFDNYYNQSHFRFELDHAQTNKLILKLSSIAVAPRTYGPYSTESWTNFSKGLQLKDKREASEASDSPVLTEDFTKYDGSPRNLDDKKLVETSVDCSEGVNGEKDFLYLKLTELALSRKQSDMAVNDHMVETAPSGGINANCGTSHNAQEILEEKNDQSSLHVSNDLIGRLLDGMAELQAFKREQREKVYTLELKLAEAHQEIHHLKHRCILLESMSNSSRANGKMVAESPEETDLEISESILLVGGYDGVDWLSTLDAYSPFNNVLKSLEPMGCARSYGSVAKLNGELYVFGGGNGSLWYDTVESYNPDQNRWTSRPSLNVKKGSLGGATLKEKIFALGGGDGINCFSDVEMFDVHVGRWIPVRSMLQERFGLASVELNGAIYAVGGYDGVDYLKSAERFDPREHSWSSIMSMNTARGCHSLVVMDQKLYALGGYDGNEMVRSIEIYDPRLGRWMMGEPMSKPRGYLAAAVLIDCICAIGGVKSGDEIVDVVECYKEGKGWQVINSGAVGRRCFNSGFVLGSD